MPQDAPFTVTISRTLKDIATEEWDRLFPPSPEGYQFFKTIEETLTRQFTFYYISIRQGSRTVCVAPCFIMDYSLETTTGGPLKTLLSWIKKALPRAFTIRVLICGSPTGEGRLGVAADADREPLAHALVGAMESIARRERAGLLAFKDFSDDDLPMFQPLLQGGFHMMPSYPAATLDLSFRSVDAYLASLSRATRKDLKRKFKTVDGRINLTMEVRRDLGESLDDAYRLYLKTFEKSQAKFELVTKEFFERISRNMPEETRYFLWYLDGRLVAFDLCLVSGTTLMDEYLGMDYAVAYDYHLYYLTFRDILNWCLQHGIRRYATGALNYDPKKRLDFTLAPQAIYFKHRNRFMNSLLSLLSAVLKPQNFDPTLKPRRQPRTRTARGRLTIPLFVLILMADALNALAELLFKQGAMAPGIHEITFANFPAFASRLVSGTGLWVGVVCYIVMFFLWMPVLSQVDLSLAFPVQSIDYLLVPLISMAVLHERVTALRWLGVLFIMLGVCLVSQSAARKTRRNT